MVVVVVMVVLVVAAGVAVAAGFSRRASRGVLLAVCGRSQMGPAEVAGV
ncbi:hypothetical protein ACWEQG_22275 [Microbispora sp. NPDC004025]